MVINIINRSLLLAVRDQINSKPVKFRWSSWILGDKDQLPEQVQACDTQCCVGGWVSVLACPPDMLLSEFAPNMEVKAFELLLGPPPETYDPKSPWYAQYAALKYFLFYPWNFEDAHGNRLVGSSDTVAETENNALWIREATNRIDWILEGRDIHDYVISVRELIRMFA